MIPMTVEGHSRGITVIQASHFFMAENTMLRKPVG